MPEKRPKYKIISSPYSTEIEKALNKAIAEGYDISFKPFQSKSTAYVFLLELVTESITLDEEL